MYDETRDFFELLGVDDDASTAEIQAAINHHRDRGSVDRRTLACAEETLLDSHARIRYGMQRAIARVRREVRAFMLGDQPHSAGRAGPN